MSPRCECGHEMAAHRIRFRRVHRFIEDCRRTSCHCKRYREAAVKPPTVGPVGGAGDSGAAPASDPGPFVAAGGWCAPADSPFTRPRPTSMWRQIGGDVYVNLPDRGNVDQWVKASAIVAIGAVAAEDSAIQARVQVSGSPTMWTTLTPDEIAARVTEAVESAEALLWA